MADLWRYETPDLGPTASLTVDDDRLVLTVDGFTGSGSIDLPAEEARKLSEAIARWYDGYPTGL